MLVLALSLLGFGAPVGGGSDDCASPEPIAGAGVFAFDNSSATSSTQGQSEQRCKSFGSTQIDHDVWFEWTADVTGAAQLSTCGTTSVDTKVAAWPGSACPIDGTVLGCSDDACGLQSSVTWPVLDGHTYMLQVGTFPGMSGGTGTFEITTVGSGKIAGYDAGVAGAPPTAPDPRAQGWTLVDPSAGAVVLSDVSPDGASGLNAWQIDDSVSASDGLAYYEHLLTPTEAGAAFVLGVDLELELRFLAGAADDLFLEVDFRYLPISSGPSFGLRFRPSGADLIATDAGGGGSYVLAGANDGDYHRVGIRTLPTYYPRQLLRFDGTAIASLDAANGPPAPGVRWGAGSDPGTASFNVHSFQLALLEPVATTDPVGRFCTGTATTTPCPCGNVDDDPFGGCANSTGEGALLAFTGSNHIGSGDQRLRCYDLVPGQPALAFAGEEPVAQGAGVPFGDGLRCVGTNLVRFGVRVPAPNGQAVWGPDLEPIGGWVAGDLRYFQAWYRDPAGSPCGTGFNLSSGVRVGFLP